MAFRFFDAAASGNEILVDSHASVVVSGGLFSVQLGSGTVTDGSGPGGYTTLSRVFANYPDLHLEVEVGGETLSPRIRVVSAGYALNTHYVRGMEIVSEGPLDLYVDATTGDDQNDGLSPLTAKETIMGAVRSVPAVMNGDVTIHIGPGTYNEEIILSRRIRNGFYVLGLVNDTDDPAQVLIEPPAMPLWDVGLVSFDELVWVRSVSISGFAEGVTGSGGTWLGLSDCVVSNNDDGVSATDGHLVSLEDGCRIESNTYGVLSFEHGTVEVAAPVSFVGNTSGAVKAEHNSSIQFDADGTCVFSGGNGPMTASKFSYVEGYGPCLGVVCNPGVDGRCVP